MTHRADHDVAGADELAAPPSRAGGAPGRSTVTSRLWRSPRRDDRGVAPGAEDAVAQLGGGGAPLPDGVRARFEQSLGADLGGVRVHTDDASASAADAVGARAFARGNDIHFGAGQYQPDDPFGLHLLAHEVAHTVQQSGGAATTQYKLAVSSPGDAAEVEADRAADAMVAGHAASVGSAGISIARDTKGDAAKADASTGGGQSANDAAIEREFDIELRREAGNRLRASYTTFSAAAQGVRAEMEKKEAQPTLIETLLEVAVGTLAPGLVGFALAPLKPRLSAFAAGAIERVIKDPTTQVTTYVKADDFIQKLELGPDKAKAGYAALTAGLKAAAVAKAAPNDAGAVTGPIPMTSGGKPMKASTLVDLFIQRYNVAVDQADMRLAGATRDTLLGVLAANDPKIVSLAFCTAQIRDLVTKHEEIRSFTDGATIPGSLGSSKNEGDRRIVMLGAWGVTQPALISHVNTSLMAGIKGHWKFEKWVEEDIIETAIAAGASQPGGLETVYAGKPYKGGFDLPILGHIDNPKSEGLRVLRVGSWGKFRLCYAKYTDDPKAEFVSWIAPAEEEYARVRAARLGGIKEVPESIFKKVPPRPEE